jgi:opacity protein-like surface antigen
LEQPTFVIVHQTFHAGSFYFRVEYAALRPRETSAAATAAVSAAVAAAAAASTAQQGLTESLTALQAGMSDINGGKSIMRLRKSSQDSGAVIPSDDEDGTGGGLHLRSSSHASGHSSTHCQRVEHKLLGTDQSAVPSPAAAAAATWRAFNRPRMALAVLAVSLQHIAAHSDHLQYHQHRRPHQPETTAAGKTNGVELTSNRQMDGNDQQQPPNKSFKQPDDDNQVQLAEPQLDETVPPLPAALVLPIAADHILTSSLDEGIEPDR